MKISKENRNRKEHDVARITQEKPHKLHNFGKAKHKDELCPEGVLPIMELPVTCGPPAGGEQQRVDDEGNRGKGRDVKGIGAPWLLSVVVVSKELFLERG